MLYSSQLMLYFENDTTEKGMKQNALFAARKWKWYEQMSVVSGYGGGV